MLTLNKAIITITLIVISISLFSFSHSYKLKADKLSAPTWADFVVVGGLNERKSGTNLDGMPYTVNINGEQWDIVLVDHFDEMDDKGSVKNGEITLPSVTEAQTYCANKTIAYIADSDHNDLRINIMHEIFHAGGCLHGGDTYWNSINPTGKYHPGIYHLGEFTASFMRANPRFTEWVSQ
jgi:hypothetical protein